MYDQRNQNEYAIEIYNGMTDESAYIVHGVRCELEECTIEIFDMITDYLETVVDDEYYTKTFFNVLEDIERIYGFRVYFDECKELLSNTNLVVIDKYSARF